MGITKVHTRRKEEQEEEEEEEGVTNTGNPGIENEELLVVTGCDLIDKVRFNQSELFSTLKVPSTPILLMVCSPSRCLSASQSRFQRLEKTRILPSGSPGYW